MNTIKKSKQIAINELVLKEIKSRKQYKITDIKIRVDKELDELVGFIYTTKSIGECTVLRKRRRP